MACVEGSVDGAVDGDEGKEEEVWSPVEDEASAHWDLIYNYDFSKYLFSRSICKNSITFYSFFLYSYKEIFKLDCIIHDNTSLLHHVSSCSRVMIENGRKNKQTIRAMHCYILFF